MYFLFDYYSYTVLSGISQLKFSVENLIHDGTFFAVRNLLFAATIPIHDGTLLLSDFFLNLEGWK